MTGTFAALISTLRRRALYPRLTRAELDAAKLARFRRLAAHAQRRSPYYAQVIAERRIEVETCTPQDFPVLTKPILMANFDAIVTDPAITRAGVADFLTRSIDPAEKFLDRYRVMHTSGTSGEVGYFLTSRADWMRGAFSGGQRPIGARPKRRGRGRFRFAFYGATGGHYAGVTMITSLARSPARLFVDARAFEINSPMSETRAALMQFQPEVLFGYTTALKMLGERKLAGELDIHPIAIAATGETATQADLNFLSHAFDGAPATSAYACTEHMSMGLSDPGGQTMTLTDDNLIFEVAQDHTLVTNLFNETMPLIRYRMSDILTVVSPPGARRIQIASLVGRTERTPEFVNAAGQSDFISPHTINEIFVAGVRRFQMRLTGKASFRFLTILEPSLDETGRRTAVAGLEARLREILEQKGMPNVVFTVDVVDEIAVNPRTRKFQLIVDERAAAA
jgi:phenylacetate-coenzyme A ligase PaaK-like adenylate-forming protein